MSNGAGWAGRLLIAPSAVGMSVGKAETKAPVYRSDHEYPHLVTLDHVGATLVDHVGKWRSASIAAITVLRIHLTADYIRWLAPCVRARFENHVGESSTLRILHRSSDRRFSFPDSVGRLNASMR